ncbi:hypothetical protein Q5H92_14685 [Hymenobacter sp. M29]|uniref:Uncharacterized protein n=1 Tax=Hymenobacter mellowenesis TaxID=3063995 RepID=A0ABT9AG01_9BACT|nr:hypothetical protein [Hymenobacter sp. M29]MDO7847612.1 hypothetical protein [Hymenobacter sp. M29]
MDGKPLIKVEGEALSIFQLVSAGNKYLQGEDSQPTQFPDLHLN